MGRPSTHIRAEADLIEPALAITSSSHGVEFCRDYE